MNPALQAILAAVTSFFVVTLVFAIILFIWKTSTKRHSCPPFPSRPGNRQQANPRSEFNPTTRRINVSELDSTEIGKSVTFDPTINRLSMRELLQATENFSPHLIIGDGSFGFVYKAKLSTGVVVAVKKLSADAFQGFREFQAEMETLGKIRHPNIVKILGYCTTKSERILVYQFIERGSLDQWLYDTSSFSQDSSSAVKQVPLSWDTRISIIEGVAKGLSYMHNLDTPIIHRDIKASNILLDAEYRPHIADFGLARIIEGSHSYVTTQVAGTMGYMPPEYLSGATKATMIGDVYSFGVLVLEIITGRQPHFLLEKGDDGEGIKFVDWVNKMVKQNRYMEMVDVNILRDGLKEDVVANVFHVGVMCASVMVKFRPSMKKVEELLNKL